MSNTMVGSVYQKIMDEVIENCVVTFEEDGVERKLLDEVKKTWQSKLTERKVAAMPWDPAPAPPSMPQNTASAPSQATSQTAPPAQSKPAQPKQEPANAAPAVKTEPGAGNYDLQNLPQSNGAATAYNSNSAAALDRTSQQLQEKFGAAAGPQISQLQARRAMVNQNTPQQQGASQVDVDAKKRQYDMQQAQQAQRMKAQLAAQQQRSVGNAQTDGSADWASFVTERRAAAAADGGRADFTLRQQLEATSLEMEGGGLLQPVARHRAPIRAARPTLASSSIPRAQFDGPGDDDDDVKDEDEDAINSDLDDPEDELDREEADDDASQGEIMLCTYDKVQRVKNKWKCTLKDGVLTTGGKEYVFHKAQGRLAECPKHCKHPRPRNCVDEEFLYDDLG